jgi:hypothetical protein
MKPRPLPRGGPANVKLVRSPGGCRAYVPLDPEPVAVSVPTIAAE